MPRFERLQVVANAHELRAQVCFQFSARHLVDLSRLALFPRRAGYFSVVDQAPCIKSAFTKLGGKEILRPARRTFVMNSRNRNVIACDLSRDDGIIARFNDALIFVGRANKEARKLDVGSPLQRRRRFRAKIDNQRRELQLAFRIGEVRLRAEIAAHGRGQVQLGFAQSALGAFDLRIELARLHGCAGERAAIS